MKKLKRYCYGPFPSRRLGLSLGIDILPKSKLCTYNCVYCEIGQTQPINLVSPEHRIHAPPSQNFRKELTSYIKYISKLDSITFGYNGEPTLNENMLDFLNIATEIRDEKSWLNNKPRFTLFTNSSTLYSQEIRDRVKKFELILAKLDVANDDDFKRTNRPHKTTPNIEIIIESLVNLKKEMHTGHKLAIQCLIFNSNKKEFISNNTPKNINDLAYALKKIKPDIVQVYSIARMPANYFVFSIDDKRKKEIVNIFRDVIKDDGVDVRYY